MHATHLREHGAGDAEGERALGHLFGEFVQTRASGDGLGGSVVRSSRARRQSSPVRSSARARPRLLVARERSLAGPIRSLDRVDDAVSTTRARARDGREARMKRNSLISNHPSDVPPLAPRARRASSRSRPIDRATLSRSVAPSSIARLPRRLPTENARETRETHTHRLVAFAALKARTLPRTADCVMDAMVVRARE